VKHKLVALSGLRERLEEMQTYLQLVLAQKIPVNNQIIYNMQVGREKEREGGRE